MGQTAVVSSGESSGDPALPVLSDEHLDRIRAMTDLTRVEVGDMLSVAGDAARDFVYLESAEVDPVRVTVPGLPEALVLSVPTGMFLGELNTVTGQAVFLTARVSKRGTSGRCRWPTFAG